MGCRGSTLEDARDFLAAAPSTMGKLVGAVIFFIRRRCEHVVSWPSSDDEKIDLAARFGERDHMDGVNCVVGSIDGKCFWWQCPKLCKPNLKNHKGKECALMVLGVCDCRCRFLHVDVGDSPQVSDQSVFDKGGLRDLIEHGGYLSKDLTVSIGGQLVPLCLVGDSAFTKRWYMLSPYDRRYTNITTDVELCNSWMVKWARKSMEAAWGRVVSRFPRFRFVVVVWCDVCVPDFDNCDKKNPDFPKINMHDLIWCGIILHNMACEHNDFSDDDSSSSDSDCDSDDDDGDNSDDDLDDGFLRTRDAITVHLKWARENRVP